MKLAMVGTRGVPARYGGFETAIEEIGSRLAARGHEVVVFCRPMEGQPQPATHAGMKLVWLPALRRRSLETLSHTAASVLHRSLSGVDAAVVFNAANAPLLPVIRARRIPVATHVDGLEWRRAKWSGTGRRYYRAAESLSVRWSDGLIADAQGIADYYTAEFDAPTRLIAYGAPILSDASSARLSELDLLSGRYHLIVARFEPENHVLELVRGYVASGATHPLVVVGSAPYADAYTAQVHEAADDRVRFLGGVWDPELLDQLYANAATYLHGHSVGGTNPSLLRAAGAGASVVAWDVGFNREVLGSHGRYVGSSAEVPAVLEEAERAPDDASARGAAGQDSVRRYDWDDVALKYERLCADLTLPPRRRPADLRRGPRPLGSGRRRGRDETGSERAATPSPTSPTDVSASSGEVGNGGGIDGERRQVLVAHPGAELYGSDRMALETVTGLVDAGATVTVALPERGALADAVEAVGARVELCRFPVLRKSALRPRGFVRLVSDVIASLPTTTRLIREHGRDGLYVSTLTIPVWVVLGRLLRTTVTCHVHEAEGSSPWPLRLALTAPVRLAHRIAVNSQFAADVMCSVVPSLRRRLTIVLNGVAGPSSAAAAREQVEGSPRVLFIGRLSPRKGPQTAVEALRLLHDRGITARLDLLGSVFPGYEWFEAELKETVRRTLPDGHVQFLGFRSEVWDELAKADVVVVPSVVDEPFGNTAVEAVLAARPLVVSDTSGLREAAAGYDSVTRFRPGDAEDLADAIERTLSRWSEVRLEAVADRRTALARHDLRHYRRQVTDLVLGLEPNRRPIT